jgi:hypothetical protein
MPSGFNPLRCGNVKRQNNGNAFPPLFCCFAAIFAKPPWRSKTSQCGFLRCLVLCRLRTGFYNWTEFRQFNATLPITGDAVKINVANHWVFHSTCGKLKSQTPPSPIKRMCFILILSVLIT